MNYSKQYLKEAHKHCTDNKEAIESSKLCGCFYCLKTFSPKKIKEYTGGKFRCAICPCGIDSVLPSSSGLPVGDKEFLKEMHQFWFGALHLKKIVRKKL